MAYSNSRRWESPEVQAKNAFNRKSLARKRFFKANFKKLEWILPDDYTQEVIHHNEMNAAKQNLLNRKRIEEGYIHIPVSAFGGKTSFHDMAGPNMSYLLKDKYPEIDLSMSRFTKIDHFQRSSILAQPSIWLNHGNPDLGANKCTITSQSGFYCEMWPRESMYAPLCLEDQLHEAFLAEWPCAQEYKYEGDDRIATDLKHSRFLPVPRKPGNSTVNWQQLPFLDQHEFDQVHCGGNRKPTEEDAIFMDLEVGFDGQLEQHVGNRLLGRSLMAELDPQGIYTAVQDYHRQ